MRGPRHQHEEHLNHEAWAIPYGDLVTLLLAFFVVMYAVSSVNEGKYRIMADALSDAFGGPPRALSAVQLGDTQQRSVVPGQPAAAIRLAQLQGTDVAGASASPSRPVISDVQARQLDSLGLRVEGALAGLLRNGIVAVRRGPGHLEIEIQSDLLFASGSAQPSHAARETIEKLGALLREEPNAIRIEGYTDNRPIRTVLFHSNWELSAARAASVVHVLSATGVAPSRLAVVGYGEHQPAADNADEAGRNRNRRVKFVVLAAPLMADDTDAPAIAPRASMDVLATISTRPKLLASSGPNAPTEEP